MADEVSDGGRQANSLSSAVWLILLSFLCLHLFLGRRYAEVVFEACNPRSAALVFDESPHRASISSYTC